MTVGMTVGTVLTVIFFLDLTVNMTKRTAPTVTLCDTIG